MTKLLKGLGAAGLAAAALLGATTTEAADLKAAIPFRFTVNERTLPPGIYDVTIEQGVVAVRNIQGGAFVLCNRAESTEHSRPRLVFLRVGEDYVLREAWMGRSGRVVPGARREGARRGGVAARAERVEVPLS